MKKFFEKIRNKADRAVVSAKTAAAMTFHSKKGEGYIDTAVKWIIGIVVGGLILTTLYVLFKDNLLVTLKSKLVGFFEYAG